MLSIDIIVQNKLNMHHMTKLDMLISKCYRTMFLKKLRIGKREKIDQNNTLIIIKSFP